MLTTLAGWATSSFGSFLIGVVTRFIRDWLADMRAEKAQKEAGRLEAEAAQLEQKAAKEQEMADIAARRDTDDDILKRLNDGTG